MTFRDVWDAMLGWFIDDKGAAEAFPPLPPPREAANHYPPRQGEDPDDLLDMELPPRLDSDGNLLRD